MLYSEIKERENRFFTTLKIVFPFFIVIAIFMYAFDFFEKNVPTIILLVALTFVYVYYIFYLIYNGFKITSIDPVTKVFTLKKIMSVIDGLEKREFYTLTFLHINNVVDINERYGVINGDRVLKEFIVELNLFLKKHGFKDILIGRVGGGNFIIPLLYPQKELAHFFMQFTTEIKSKGIHDIEVKVNTFFLNASYDTKAQNCIERFYMMLNESEQGKKEALNIKVNDFEEIVVRAIDQNGFSFKYQPSINTQTNQIQILEVLPKIQTKEHGVLSKNQIERIINYGGYERSFDQKLLKALLKEVKSFDIKDKKISLEISPVTLRNNNFKLFINALIREEKLDPKMFIFEILEKESYEDLGRFKEIIMSYQEMGFSIALGNFGGNNCSLEYIKHLPVDLIKFDIEFTKKLDNERHMSVLNHMLQLAVDLKIQTMIKFIDKEAVFERVKELNPDYIQGFYVSKPKKIGELDEIW